LRRSSGVDQLVLLSVSLYIGSGATEVVGKSQWLVSERRGLCVPLLAACGGGLVALVVTEFLTLFLMVSVLRDLSGCLVQTPNCCFCNPFLSAIRGGIGGRAGGETVLLTWLLGVSRGDTRLFLPDLVEVQDVGACVVRLWSHVVAPVFRVVLGPTLVVGRGISLFRCFVVLYGIPRFCHGSVDTPIDGVDTGSEFLKLFHENKVKNPTQDKSQEHSGRREEEREKGICIQRSRAAPPREEEEEEEGEEEEKELVIAAVLIKKKIQPKKLGSIVIQRFEYFVLCFEALVLWVGAVVLWCLSRSAQGLVNLPNSQVVFGVGRCAYVLGFFESLHSKRLESSCSSCTALVLVVPPLCNKSGHMKANCLEGKKEKHINHKKEFHKKKNKSMVATWSDDESSDCNKESSTSDENEVCFMAGSSEEQVDISFELFTIED
ncbi:hypothetical protein Taro_016049, partial [Colocasia esculenta]|nr:hypothetical protein [Colocasia esculenta]